MTRRVSRVVLWLASALRGAIHRLLALLLPSILPAQTAYYRHAFFDNSLQRDLHPPRLGSSFPLSLTKRFRRPANGEGPRPYWNRDLAIPDRCAA